MREQLEHARETFRIMYFEGVAGKTGEGLLCRLCRGEQRRHGEIVLGGERRGDKARIDHPNADSFRLQIEVERLGKVDQRRLGRTVDQRFGQAAVPGNTGDEADLAVTLAQQLRHDTGSKRECTAEVHVEHAARLADLELPGAHRLVVARQVERHIDAAPGRQQGLPGRAEARVVGRIAGQHQGLLGIAGHFRQAKRAARRERDASATRQQQGRQRRADAARGAEQPDAFARPLSDRWIHRRRAG
jgi:hypothetical protein